MKDRRALNHNIHLNSSSKLQFIKSFANCEKIMKNNKNSLAFKLNTTKHYIVNTQMYDVLKKMENITNYFIYNCKTFLCLF